MPTHFAMDSCVASIFLSGIALAFASCSVKTAFPPPATGGGHSVFPLRYGFALSMNKRSHPPPLLIAAVYFFGYAYPLRYGFALSMNKRSHPPPLLIAAVYFFGYAYPLRYGFMRRVSLPLWHCACIHLMLSENCVPFICLWAAVTLFSQFAADSCVVSIFLYGLHTRGRLLCAFYVSGVRLGFASPIRGRRVVCLFKNGRGVHLKLWVCPPPPCEYLLVIV